MYRKLKGSLATCFKKKMPVLVKIAELMFDLNEAVKLHFLIEF
jgi:hypothetical protein